MLLELALRGQQRRVGGAAHRGDRPLEAGGQRLAVRAWSAPAWGRTGRCGSARRPGTPDDALGRWPGSAAASAASGFRTSRVAPARPSSSSSEPAPAGRSRRRRGPGSRGARWRVRGAASMAMRSCVIRSIDVQELVGSSAGRGRSRRPRQLVQARSALRPCAVGAARRRPARVAVCLAFEERDASSHLVVARPAGPRRRDRPRAISARGRRRARASSALAQLPGLLERRTRR